MKICAKCKELVALESFTACRKAKDKKGSYCAPCRRKKWTEFYEENKDLQIKKARKWESLNPEKHKEIHLKSNKKYHAINKDRVDYKRKKVKAAQKNYNKNKENKKQYNKEYASKNRQYFTNAANLRRACIKYSLLCKSFKKECISIYKSCLEGYEVDHIIPLTHKDVCGLHVPWNLQILSTKENSFKRNKFDGDYNNNSWKDDL